jgi:hypothetical protein
MITLWHAFVVRKKFESAAWGGMMMRDRKFILACFASSADVVNYLSQTRPADSHHNAPSQ